MNQTIRAGFMLMPLLLTGCGEPSDTDLKAALEYELKIANAVTTSVMGDSGKIEILSVKKLGCDEDHDAWQCTINIQSRLPLVGERQRTRRVKVAKDDDGWKLVE